MKIRMTATPAQAADILARLDTTGPTTEDFERMGYTFEHFLGYAQLKGKYLEMAHDRLRPALEAKAAE